MHGDDAGDLASRLGCVIQNLSLDTTKPTDFGLTLNLHQSPFEQESDQSAVKRKMSNYNLRPRKRQPTRRLDVAERIRIVK